MSWLWGSSSSAQSAPATTTPQSTQSDKPKPCCVCKTEKSARDDCMLFSKSEDPAQDCMPLIERYKTCMAGYGFKI